MHELGIVFHIIDTVEEIAQQNELTEVSSVTLEIGEVSTVIPDYLKDCWKWAVERTKILKGSQLNVETIKAVTMCNSCHSTYETVKYAKVCPNCGSDDTYLITGTEVQIKEIEAV